MRRRTPWAGRRGPGVKLRASRSLSEALFVFPLPVLPRFAVLFRGSEEPWLAGRHGHGGVCPLRLGLRAPPRPLSAQVWVSFSQRAGRWPEHGVLDVVPPRARPGVRGPGEQQREYLPRARVCDRASCARPCRVLRRQRHIVVVSLPLVHTTCWPRAPLRLRAGSATFSP